MSDLNREYTTGDGRSITVAEVAKTWRSCVGCLVPAKGKIRKVRDGEFTISCGFKAVDSDAKEQKRIVRDCFVSAKGQGTIDCVSNLSDAHRIDELAHIITDDGNLSALLKDKNNSESKERQILEIWSASEHLKTLIVSEVESHGQICVDEVFSSISWNRCEPYNKLMYICQAKSPKNISFFANKYDAQPGLEYMHKEDWGECLTGIEHTLVACLEVNDFNIQVIEVGGYSLADAQWFDNDEKVITVGYKEQPRRLGLVYCDNRESEIFVHDWASKSILIRLSSETLSFSNPRVNNALNAFVYLSNPKFGSHKHTKKLHLYPLKTQKSVNLINDSELCIEELPKQCFSTDDKNIIFVTCDELGRSLNMVDIEKVAIKKLEFPINGVNILDFSNDLILAYGSDINIMPTMYIASLNEHIAWHHLDGCVCLDDLTATPHLIPLEDGTEKISAIIVEPNLEKLQRDYKKSGESLIKSPDDLPTIVLVHGGPNANFHQVFMAPLLFFARLGLKCLMINYRGSYGVSEKHLKMLCGNIGRMDIDDCLYGIRHFVHKGLINPKKLIISGGSHGGFIAAHLSCQDEFKFTSAVLRNPVIDLTSMLQTSDIPDWVAAEGLDLDFDHKWTTTLEQLVRLSEVSPTAKVDRANVPSLVILGNSDRRVVMSQGMIWLNALKARGIETCCKVYPDKHQLQNPETSADSNITAVLWILDHL